MVLVKRMVSILTTLVLALVIALCVILVVSKMNGGKTTIFGNELMVVLSGSMAPTFDTGSMVAIKPVKFKEIQKGDIVTFQDSEDKVVTHRVIDIADGKLITKGDANKDKDTLPVTSGQVLGEVQFSVPYMGYLVDFVKSKTGILLFLGIPGLYLIVSQIWKLFKMISREQANNNKDAKTQV